MALTQEAYDILYNGGLHTKIRRLDKEWNEKIITSNEEILKKLEAVEQPNPLEGEQ